MERPLELPGSGRSIVELNSLNQNFLDREDIVRLIDKPFDVLRRKDNFRLIADVRRKKGLGTFAVLWPGQSMMNCFLTRASYLHITLLKILPCVPQLSPAGPCLGKKFGPHAHPRYAFWLNPPGSCPPVERPYEHKDSEVVSMCRPAIKTERDSPRHRRGAFGRLYPT